MWRFRNWINHLKAGWRLGRLTLWMGARTAERFKVEDMRRYGGKAIYITISPRPSVHSHLNWLVAVRMR